MIRQTDTMTKLLMVDLLESHYGDFVLIDDKIGHVYRDESIWDGVIKIRTDVYICFCCFPDHIQTSGDAV